MDIFITIGVVILVLLIIFFVANYGGENFVRSYLDMEEHAETGFITAKEFVSRVIFKKFDGKIAIAYSDKMLSDAYNPGRRVIILSSTTSDKATSVAFAVAAHELGHAEQQKDTPKKFYRFLYMRAFSAKISFLVMPLIVIGAFCMLFFSENFWVGGGIAIAGFGIFALCIIVRLLTIPIEKDASRRAIEFMKKYSEFDTKELRVAKKILRLALLTYIGDFFRASLMWTGLVKKTKL